MVKSVASAMPSGAPTTPVAYVITASPPEPQCLASEQCVDRRQARLLLQLSPKYPPVQMIHRRDMRLPEDSVRGVGLSSRTVVQDFMAGRFSNR